MRWRLLKNWRGVRLRQTPVDPPGRLIRLWRNPARQIGREALYLRPREG